MIIHDTESADLTTPTGPMRTYLVRPSAEGRYSGAYLQWHEFNAAHAFLRDEGPRYDPAAAAARIGYDMALELFQRTLDEGDQRPAAMSTVTNH